jgi:translation elongation factor EF-Tu-like GTPase
MAKRDLATEQAQPNRPGGSDVLARITLLSTDSGGRAMPAWSGYRPHHRLGKYQTSGTHTYVGRDQLAPGETVEATITFITTEVYPGSIAEGDVIEIAEGGRVVGHATILAVLNPILQRSG